MDTDSPTPAPSADQTPQAPVPPTSRGTEVVPDQPITPPVTTPQPVAPPPVVSPQSAVPPTLEAVTPPAQPTPPPTLQPETPPGMLPADPTPPSGRGLLSVVAFAFSWVIFPIAAVFILHFFVFQAYHVVGTSMVPTLHTSDYLIISKVDSTKALLSRDLLHHNDIYIPHREQIIVFHYPKDPTLIFVKRVIGLPGDHVVVANGSVTIYNNQNPRGFDPNTGYEAKNTQTLGSVNVVIPAGQVFVLGDNRTPGGSFDSRDWGEVPSSYIIGNAVLRLLPLDQARSF